MDVERLEAHSKEALDRFVEAPWWAGVPVALFLIMQLADEYTAREWWLAALVGAGEGIGFAFWLIQLNAVSRSGRPVTVVGSMVLFALLSFFSPLGGLALLALASVPALELGRAAPAFVRSQGPDWLAGQPAQAVFLMLVWIAVSSLASVLLGTWFGALLTALVVGPIAQLWALQRAAWCRA